MRKINLEKIFKGLKPVRFELVNPNEIIERQYEWRQVRGLPPIRKTREEWAKYDEKERERSKKCILKELRNYQKLQAYQRKHPSKITFTYCYN